MLHHIEHFYNKVAEPYATTYLDRQPKASLSEVNVGLPEFYVKNNMNGTREYKYHDNFAELMDKVFTYDDVNYLSVDQERFIKRFFKEADIVIANMSSDKPKYDNVHKEYEDLDHFLGSYGL